ncbi:hypothetical protein SODALDRAFT_331833 [Sodiomyces alkalinus F11]|uniref:Thioredoxin-like protein n=1 Tax=Sodiomyces alkalinus (strain CBS 110278 / VKM F-3762 / F11) TaxID=1314773 RepID=A0A3N2PYW8_SODAK|nr:hypothetical protein SODALDRAFT_331833 [Sodiomyces alkalinus F11]ROT39720.1 hypothetical protein SODALDRAFT_331833 [Sodiomyces alkalinus F11]
MTTYSTDPALYIFTSLTAGSSHIVTATSRLETILRANRVPFKAVDIAVDEKARMLWGRRAGKDESGRVRKLPGLVQEGLVLGDIVEIEDWNEYGELKQHVKIYYDEHTIPSIHNKPKDPPMTFGPAKPAAQPAAVAAVAAAAAAPPAAPPLPKAATTTTGSTVVKKEEPKKSEKVADKATLPIRSIADEAAQKAKDLRLQSLREKVHGSKAAAEKKKEEEEEKKDTEEETKGQSAAKKELAGLQSPTTAKWKTPATAPDAATASSSSPSSSSTDALPAAETIQSPTTGRWKSSEPFEPPATSHRGSVLVPASETEIKAVEQAQAIPEVSSSEEEDDEDEDDEDDDDEEDEKEEKVAKVGKDDRKKDGGIAPSNLA